MRPPVSPPAGENPTSWMTPRKAVYDRPMPRSVRPHGAPISLPGPHSTYQPDSSSTNGSR